MQVRAWSLRNRLMALAGIAIIAAWLTGGLAVFFAARDEGRELYDARLEDVAAVVLAFAKHEIEEIRAERPGDVVHLDAPRSLDHHYVYQVWSADGELLLITRDTRREPFAPLKAAGHLSGDIDGASHAIFVLWSRDRSMQIQVAERSDLREYFYFDIDYYLIVFFIVSTAVLGLLNGLLIVRTTRALDQSAAQLVNRSVDDLRPISVGNPPRELKPLIESINGLFSRFARTLDAERQFTASAAHELQTPLAAVRLQAQVADRARSPEEAHAALLQLGVCVDRASRMVEQLLTLAQVESMTTLRKGTASIRLDELAARVIDDMGALLRKRGIDLSTDLQPATLEGLEFSVAALLRNLIDNAARYCPANGRVDVSTGELNREVFAAVDDSGPGIPASQRERVFERFHRLEGTGEDGCGVGLSIVQGVVRMHGARIELSDSELGGLRVVVSFPASRPRVL